MFAKDKIQHFVAGMVFAAIPAVLDQSILVVLLVALAAGVGKEVYDFIANKVYGVSERHVDFFDALATFLGAIPVVLIQLFLSI